MNVKLTALLVAMSFMVSSSGEAGQAVGTAKARGDYRGFNQAQQSMARSTMTARPVYRYSAPVVREVPSEVVAAAPVEGRRYSQAPAAQDENVTSATPCPSTPVVASQGESGRRYSYAPAPQYSASPTRSYPSSAGRTSQPAWSLQKAHPGKYEVR